MPGEPKGLEKICKIMAYFEAIDIAAQLPQKKAKLGEISSEIEITITNNNNNTQMTRFG